MSDFGVSYPRVSELNRGRNEKHIQCSTYDESERHSQFIVTILPAGLIRALPKARRYRKKAQKAQKTKRQATAK
jgi:hypothetical protein